MTDDLDDLKAAMRAATPEPDTDMKAAHLALAQKTFATLQESRDGARQTSDRPKKGLFRGVAKMFSMMSTRGALTASTALVALGLVVVMPDWQQDRRFFDRTSTISEENRSIAEQISQNGTQESEDGILGIAGGLNDTQAEADLFAEPAIKAPIVLEGPAVAARKSLSGLVSDEIYIQPQDSHTEAYPEATQNPLKITTEDPVSTFSIDVDTASYAIIRSSLSRGQLPPEGAVRIEEMVNYFPYNYPAPQAGTAPFKPTVSVTNTPWNPNTQLVHIAIQGEKPVVDDRPPLNLVFLIDTSGSMNQPDKLPLLKQSLSLMLSKLSERDQISIVTYAGSAGRVLEPTATTERATILGALDRLQAGGSTAGQAGLQQAYEIAEGMAQDGEVTRVILATDGDFNVGLSDPEDLKNYISDKRDSGTYLSVMGFGRGNLNDATMQALAQNGNGQAAFIDTLSEAQKVLVDQFTGALFPIANDVKIQVEFNPAQIAEYRLIGYETRALNREDFNNDKVDAGEIGAGHSVTALYEITPVGSPAQLSDPLRYSTETGAEAEAEAEAEATGGDELGYFKLRYKSPGAADSQLMEIPILPSDNADGSASQDMQFATAIAGFGQLLQGGTYLNDWGYDEAIALANNAKGTDHFGYRAEAVRLMRLAQSLSQN